MEANNMVAMREALVKIEKMAHCDLSNVYPRYRDKFNDKIGGIEREANAALSAPPRNCDVGTAEEQIERFNEFCNSEWRDSGNANCGNCPLWVSGTIGDDCQIRWAQMPYEEQEGGAK